METHRTTMNLGCFGSLLSFSASFDPGWRAVPPPAGIRARQGAGHAATKHRISKRAGRWSFGFLPRSGAEGRAADSAAARIAVVFAHVRAALRSALRSIPPDRGGLPRLRPQ